MGMQNVFCRILSLSSRISWYGCYNTRLSLMVRISILCRVVVTILLECQLFCNVAINNTQEC